MSTIFTTSSGLPEILSIKMQRQATMSRSTSTVFAASWCFSAFWCWGGWVRIFLRIYWSPYSSVGPFGVSTVSVWPFWEVELVVGTKKSWLIQLRFLWIVRFPAKNRQTLFVLDITLPNSPRPGVFQKPLTPPNRETPLLVPPVQPNKTTNDPREIRSEDGIWANDIIYNNSPTKLVAFFGKISLTKA